MRHTISVLVENKFGVLTRIAGLFSGRGYNIDTLNVGPTDDPTEWRFRHPLIRDVAYASTLASRRRDLHASLADHLETLDPPPPIGQLAQHPHFLGERVAVVRDDAVLG